MSSFWQFFDIQMVIFRSVRRTLTTLAHTNSYHPWPVGSLEALGQRLADHALQTLEDGVWVLVGVDVLALQIEVSQLLHIGEILGQRLAY